MKLKLKMDYLTDMELTQERMKEHILVNGKMDYIMDKENSHMDGWQYDMGMD